MIRYTLLIEEDRQRVSKPGNGYREPEYEETSHVLCKVEGETASRSTALDAIIAAAKDLQPVKVQASQVGMTSTGSVYQPTIRNGGA